MTLDEMRKHTGLTIAQMSAESGISINTYYKHKDSASPPRTMWLAVKAIFHRLS